MDFKPELLIVFIEDSPVRPSEAVTDEPSYSPRVDGMRQGGSDPETGLYSPDFRDLAASALACLDLDDRIDPPHAWIDDHGERRCADCSAYLSEPDEDICPRCVALDARQEAERQGD